MAELRRQVDRLLLLSLGSGYVRSRHSHGAP